MKERRGGNGMEKRREERRGRDEKKMQKRKVEERGVGFVPLPKFLWAPMPREADSSNFNAIKL